MASTQAPPKGAFATHEVLNLPEAAAYLRISEDALQELAAEQRIPARKIGQEWRFLKTALQDWLRQGSSLEEMGRWGDFFPWKLLLAELEHRSGRRSKERLLELAGVWKADPSLDEMLREIYRGRGRPMTEGEE